MRKVAERLEKLEKSMRISPAPITDVRKATDAQLEAFMASLGIDTTDEAALVAVAEGRTPKIGKK